KNSLSDPQAYNTSAANLGVAFNALKDALRDGVTATFSAAMSAGTSVTITLSAAYKFSSNADLVQIVDSSMQSSAPAQISAVTTRSTPGGGFTTGTYSI